MIPIDCEPLIEIIRTIQADVNNWVMQRSFDSCSNNNETIEANSSLFIFIATQVGERKV